MTGFRWAVVLAVMLSPAVAAAQNATSAASPSQPAAAAEPPAAAPAEAAAPRTKSPPGAQVYFIWPRNGTVIKGGKFWVRMGLQGMGVAPAGVEHENTGHHHMIVDAELPPMDEPIPNDANHLHFGGGQTEARLELSKGTHTIQLLLADANHIPHDPPVVSERITIRVR